MKRTHKIGTVTFGISLVAVGGAFLLHFFVPAINVATVISFWPVILILLGLEVLTGSFMNREEITVTYDKTGIILTALLVLFTMGMGMMSLVMEYVVKMAS